jgi:predicted small lipoprotein YifL
MRKIVHRALALAILFAVAGCGVKSDLETPDGKTTKTQHDPSKPPSSIGR